MKNKVIIKGDIADIHINSKKYGSFIVNLDVEDLPRIEETFSSLYLHAVKCKIKTLYYVKGEFEGNKILIHRFIMNCPKDYVIDHIDGNPLNNRKTNLRICTQGENRLNTMNIGKFPKGVTLDKRRNKFFVRITLEKGYEKFIGYYETLEEATEVANRHFAERGINYK